MNCIGQSAGRKLFFPLLILALTDAAVCNAQSFAKTQTLPTSGSVAEIPLIPAPVSMKAEAGFFSIGPSTKVYSSPQFLPLASRFIKMARLSAGRVGALPRSVAMYTGGICFIKSKDLIAGDTAGYRLHIKTDHIEIVAHSIVGALYGMESLWQLMLLHPDKPLPCVVIEDRPRFQYRGLMLDVSRNFYPISFVKELLDLMALYKMNTLHWHLTDGPGWRLEIKKYPRLTQLSAWRSHLTWREWWANGRKYKEEGDPMAYGGYYTQADAKEVVAYAAERGIIVIPEIEMPGHSEEVTTAYPSLSCSGLPYKNGELCLGNDSTFTFLEDVLTEVMQIFPSTYIHVGGDEAGTESWKHCPKCQDRIRREGLKNESELQSYGVKRIEKFLNAHGRKLLGWDEIMEGGLAPSATVMSWRGTKGGIEAASMGHDVIMTPGSYCYFDHYQADPATQPEAIGGFLPLKTVYSFEPVPQELKAENAGHVIGAQANLWTEYISSAQQAEYMLFPRLLALAEVTWSAKNHRDWDDFRERLYHQYFLLQSLHVNYCRPSSQVDIHAGIDYQSHATHISMESEQYSPVIRYTLDGSRPVSTSALYKDSLIIKDSARLRAAVFLDTALQGIPSSLDVDYHKAIGKKVTYNLPYSESYIAQKESTLVNGYRGSMLTYGDGQWQGFTNDMDITIDMEKPGPLKSLSMRFMQITGPGVFMPEFVEVSVSDNGKDFKPFKRIDNDVPTTRSELLFKDFKFDLNGITNRYIRVLAKNAQGFLFTDEVVIY
ncbi:MAG: family 20 glycosylhydrolase [Bacteroidetes bacterium]|nr:family 20 glycosylhydrolase [Bacteroidota bacterium]